jgi:hypothetical protein
MNNTHEDHPVVMQVRWCMSYLRGPLTRTQIKALMDPVRATFMPPASSAGASTPSQNHGARPAAADSDSSPPRPVLASTIAEFFMAVRPAHPPARPVVAVPHVLRAAEIVFSDSKKSLNGKKKFLLLDPLAPELTGFDWSSPVRLEEWGPAHFSTQPGPGVAEYRPLPAFALQARAYTALKASFVDYCFASEGMELLYSDVLDTWSQPGESEGVFRARLAQISREARDEAVQALRTKYARKAAPLEERLRRSEAAVIKEKEQQQGAWIQTAATLGGSVLGALFGRKKVSIASATVRQASSAWKQQGDVGRAEDTVAAVRQQLEALDAECSAEITALAAKLDALTTPLKYQTVAPLKKNIVVTAVGVAWMPFFQVSATELEPAWA